MDVNDGVPARTMSELMAYIRANPGKLNYGTGLFGPVGLPREVIDRLGRDMAKVLARADVQDQLGRLAFDPQSSSGEELGALVKEQLGGWRKAVREAGIPVE